MEETFTYGTSGNGYDLSDLNDWYYNDANGQDIFDRDLDMQDRDEDYYERIEDCNNLLISKPSECTTNPGSFSDYIHLFSGWPAANTNILPYRNLFQNALLAAALDFARNQDSNTATTIFFDVASYDCVEGDGQNISAPTIWPVTNSAYCIIVADGLASAMYPDFTLPSNFTINLGIVSFPLSEFGPWGNKFYEGITAHLACRAWYNNWNALQC